MHGRSFLLNEKQKHTLAALGCGRFKPGTVHSYSTKTAAHKEC